MKKEVLFLFFLIIGISFVSAVPETHLYYFYSNTCPHCIKVLNSGILDEVSSWENVTLDKYEVAISERNRKKLFEYADKLGAKEVGTPFLVIEQKGELSYLSGDTSIIEGLKDAIINFKSAPKKSGLLEKIKNYVVEGFFNNFDKSTGQLSFLGWVFLIFAALIDSINPCAFGVLLFLMTVLLSMGSAKRAFRAGIVYTFVIFLVYFLSGIVIVKILGSFPFLNSIRVAIGVAILIGALIEIKDFFWEGKGISLMIPSKAKPILEKYVRKGTIPAVVVLGALVALVELPCTGLIYLAVLSLISSGGSIGLIYLLIYNLIFILPLVIITYAIYKGSKVESINKWVQKNKRYMRLGAGIIMILLALLLFGLL